MPFRGFYEPEASPGAGNNEQAEQFAYVGCVHGKDENLLQKLAKLAGDKPPDHLIFMGDLTGSPEMEELKRRFYNLVQNRSKPLLFERPDITDEELLAYSEPSAPQEAPTLRDGYKALYAYQLFLEGVPQQTIEEKLAGLSDAEIASGIRYISSLQYYGNFVAALSAEVRMGVLRTLESSAKEIMDTLGLLPQSTKITMVGGNWDFKYSGVREITGNDITAFDTMGFFRNRNIPCVEEMEILETENAFHILVSFDALLDLEKISETRLAEMEKRCEEARSRGKAIIMIGHGEANWKMHTLHIPNPPANPPARDTSIRNFGRLIARFKPDQVAYPHQHNRIVDEMRREIGLNVKFVLEGTADGDGVQLVENPDEIGAHDNQTVVTYVPFRHIARGEFVRKAGQRVFDGSQKPITVLTA